MQSVEAHALAFRRILTEQGAIKVSLRCASTSLADTEWMRDVSASAEQLQGTGAFFSSHLTIAGKGRSVMQNALVPDKPWSQYIYEQEAAFRAHECRATSALAPEREKVFLGLIDLKTPIHAEYVWVRRNALQRYCAIFLILFPLNAPPYRRVSRQMK